MAVKIYRNDKYPVNILARMFRVTELTEFREDVLDQIVLDESALKNFISRKLPILERKVVKMYFQEGYSFEDITYELRGPDTDKDWALRICENAMTELRLPSNMKKYIRFK